MIHRTPASLRSFPDQVVFVPKMLTFNVNQASFILIVWLHVVYLFLLTWQWSPVCPEIMLQWYLQCHILKHRRTEQVAAFVMSGVRTVSRIRTRTATITESKFVMTLSDMICGALTNVIRPQFNLNFGCERTSALWLFDMLKNHWSTTGHYRFLFLSVESDNWLKNIRTKLQLEEL